MPTHAPPLERDAPASFRESDLAVLDRPRPGAGFDEYSVDTTSERGRGLLRPICVVLLVYSALSVLLYWRVWGNHPASRTALGPDQWLSTWFLAWTAEAIRHGHNPLVSTYANSPGGVNLLSNTGLTFLGVIGTPITLLFGPVATTNVMLTAGPALSATTACVFIRRFSSTWTSAFVGGLIYGLGPFVMWHSYIHINLTFNFVPPLIFLVLYEMVVDQPRRMTPLRWGAILAVLLTVQFFISSEVMATTIVLGACGVLVAALLRRDQAREKFAYAARGLAWTAGLTTLLLAYPIWFLLWGPAHIVGPIQLTPQAYRADLLGVIVPTRAQLLAPFGLAHFARDFANSENGSYLGLPLLAFTIAGVVWLRRRAVVVATAILAVVAFVLSLGGALAVSGAPASNVHGDAVGRVPLPEAILGHLPLLHNVIPARFAMYVALFAALIFACLLDKVYASLKSSRSRYALVAPAAMAVVALIPMMPAASPIAVGRLNVPAYYTSSAVKAVPAGSVALIYPFPSGTYAAGNLWQASAGFRFRTPGGYFRVPQPPAGRIAFNPQLGYTEDTPTAQALVALGRGRPPAMTPELRDQMRAQLAAWHVQSVIATIGVRPGHAADPVTPLAFFEWLLGPASTQVGTTYAWYGVTQ